MGKQTIQLTEEQFKKVIKESVKKIVEAYDNERMKWDSGFISELANYAEAQELTDNLMSDTDFGDIRYEISENGYRLNLWFESEEDANDFVDIMDSSVGEYDFLRNPEGDRSMVMVELPA